MYAELLHILSGNANTLSFIYNLQFTPARYQRLTEIQGALLVRALYNYDLSI